jgi:DNA-binding CsgD family transcriptional regulator
MHLLDLLLKHLGLRRETEAQKYASDVSFHPDLDYLVEQQQRSPDEVISSLVASGLAQQTEQQELIQRWYLLTPREQNVAALACMGYSNPDIASILNITRETVKSHMSNALAKFGFSSRAELKVMLRGWDFSAWEPHP